MIKCEVFYYQNLENNNEIKKIKTDLEKFINKSDWYDIKFNTINNGVLVILCHTAAVEETGTAATADMLEEM